MIRLGTKYEISNLRVDATYVLSSQFPTALKRWDHKYPQGVRPRADAPNDPNLLIKWLHLVEEFNLSFLMPALLLRICSSMTMQQILESDISRGGLNTLLLGRERLLQDLKNTVLSGADLNLQECNAAGCLYTKHQFLMNVLSHDPTHEPFYYLRRSRDPGPVFHAQFCDKCHVSVKAKLDAGREALWNKLPQYFALESWEELRKKETEGECVTSTVEH